jgi:hypothetical protein
MASGTIGYVARTNGQVIYLCGKLTEPGSGRFFFQKQTRPGVAGEFVGLVEFPSTERAYRIEPSGPDGAPELVEHALGDVVCLRFPVAGGAATNQTAQIPPLNPGNFPNLPPPGYQNGISVLESLHGATAVVYLDFQGGYTPAWGGVTYQRPAVSNDQVREVWRRVAEDVMPFNINVTTDLRVFQNAPEASRQRVVITPTTTASPEAGGVAYIGSFNFTGDTPCWVFLTSGKVCAEACSHEIGHALGLKGHEGQDYNGVHVEYCQGQGLGEVAWAPIMGVGYYRNVSEWCRGDYLYANNQDDELGMIVAKNNNVAYRADDTGDTLASSRYLELYADYTASAEGVIERTADTDAFQFSTAGGAVSLRADPVDVGPNLALAVSLYDVNDQLVTSNCPQDTLWAALTTNLPAGTYTFRVTGAGRGDPSTNGFSNYGSLGYYSITGSVANAALPDRFAIAEHATNGTVVGTVAAHNGRGDPLTFAIVSGTASNTFAIDNSGVLTVSYNRSLDYTTLANQTQLTVQFQLFVNITDLLNASLSETNRRVVVAVLPVIGPPVITQHPPNLAVPAGQDVALTVSASADQALFDPLNYQWFFKGMAIADATTSELSITDVQAQNEGDYTVVITNFEGEASSVATLTVIPAAPKFIQQPVAQSVLVGASVGFQVLAVGSEPISYQWQLNGTNLDGYNLAKYPTGATEVDLALAGAGSSDMGPYHVVASNVAGVTISSPAQLTISSLVAWGWNAYGQTNVPVDLSVGQISAGAYHNLALLRDGSVIAWGSGAQAIVPPGVTNVVQVAAGGSYSLALKRDGTVVAWGDDTAGQTDVPSGVTNAVRVAAGGSHGLALLRDGTVAAWGENTNGQCNVPLGLSNVVAIAAGNKHSLALRADGAVVAWGDNSFGQLNVPPNLIDVVSITAGAQHSLALTTEGQLVAWGDDSYGQLHVPAGTSAVVAVAGGGFHNLALRSGGTVVAWGAGELGSSDFPVLGQAAVPPEAAHISAIAAGLAHSLVLIGDGAPFLTEPPVSRVAYRHSRVVFRAAATGALPLSYQWQLGRINLPNARSPVLILNDTTNAGEYQVTVSNRFGVATSAPARLLLVDGPSAGAASGALADGLDGYWTFDELSGGVLHDFSGHGNDGSLVNFPGNLGNWTSGQFGGALRFSGASTQQYVSVPNFPMPTTSMTLAAWVWADSYAGWATIAAGSNAFLYSMFGGGPNMGLVVAESIGIDYEVSSASLSLNQWHFIGFVADSLTGIVTFMQDGATAGGFWYTRQLVSSSPELDIGDGPGGGGWDGKIDDLAIWTRALTPQELRSIYNAGLRGQSLLTLLSQPELAITPVGPSIILTWPTNSTHFNLQSASNLVSPIWTTNLPPPVVANGQNTVTIPITAAQRFFRLSQ